MVSTESSLIEQINKIVNRVDYLKLPMISNIP